MGSDRMWKCEDASGDSSPGVLRLASRVIVAGDDSSQASLFTEDITP